MTSQMTLFTPNFGSQIRRIEIDGVVLFSILDVFEHFGSKGSAVNPSVYWKRVEKRLQAQSDVRSEIITGLLSHRFEGKKQRETPVGTFKLFMRIVQVSEIREWEPMRDWMAQIAQERIEETANPALGIKWAQERFLDSKMNQGMDKQEAEQFLVLVQEGHIIRRQWTHVLKRVVIGAIGYGTITNAEYEVLFGMTAKQISEITGFSPARDGMTKTGRQIVNAVECALEDEFNRHTSLTFPQAMILAKQVCSEFKPTIERVQARTGISLATGLPLLSAGH